MSDIETEVQAEAGDVQRAGEPASKTCPDPRCLVCGSKIEDLAPRLFCSAGCVKKARERVYTLDDIGGRFPLPFDPLYSLAVVAELMGIRVTTLRSFLARHRAEFPARYLLQGREHRRVRVLTATEGRRIRSRMLRWPFDGPRDAWGRGEQATHGPSP